MFKFGFDCNDVDHEDNNKIDEYSSDSLIVSFKSILPLRRDESFSLYGRGTNYETKRISSESLKLRILNSQTESFRRAEESHSDLVPGLYEGGLKIWECTNDLLEYLDQLEITWKDKNVLDMGCGAGMLGVFGLSRGARVTFQDYNIEVLQLVTGPNVLLNIPDADCSRVEFYSGDWSSFAKLCHSKTDRLFDMILASETIYNTASYGKSVEVIETLLAPQGVCYIAAKSVYFGVGGSVYQFMKFIEQTSTIKAEVCWSTSLGVSREIVRITKRQ